MAVQHGIRQLANVSQYQGGGFACRTDADAEGEREAVPRAGNRKGRQSTHPRECDRTRLWVLRFQPESEQSQWYERRFGLGSERIRKIGIVALARKLLIALWRFVETGVIPEGAVLKTDLRLH